MSTPNLAATGVNRRSYQDGFAVNNKVGMLITVNPLQINELPTGHGKQRSISASHRRIRRSIAEFHVARRYRNPAAKAARNRSVH